MKRTTRQILIMLLIIGSGGLALYNCLKKLRHTPLKYSYPQGNDLKDSGSINNNSNSKGNLDKRLNNLDSFVSSAENSQEASQVAQNSAQSASVELSEISDINQHIIKQNHLSKYPKPTQSRQHLFNDLPQSFDDFVKQNHRHLVQTLGRLYHSELNFVLKFLENKLPKEQWNHLIIGIKSEDYRRNIKQVCQILDNTYRIYAKHNLYPLNLLRTTLENKANSEANLVYHNLSHDEIEHFRYQESSPNTSINQQNSLLDSYANSIQDSYKSLGVNPRASYNPNNLDMILQSTASNEDRAFNALSRINSEQSSQSSKSNKSNHLSNANHSKNYNK